MSKGAVGFRHAVGIFALLYGTALTLAGVAELSRQAFHHRYALARTRVADDPSDRQRCALSGFTSTGT